MLHKKRLRMRRQELSICTITGHKNRVYKCLVHKVKRSHYIWGLFWQFIFWYKKCLWGKQNHNKCCKIKLGTNTKNKRIGGLKRPSVMYILVILTTYKRVKVLHLSHPLKNIRILIFVSALYWIHKNNKIYKLRKSTIRV